jgi:hypothetical protein
MKEAITNIKATRLSGLWANVPGYSLVERLIDLVTARQRIRIVVTSDGYCEVRLLWGAVEFSKGFKREFLIEGGPGFCERALLSLERSKSTVQVVSRVVGKRD